MALITQLQPALWDQVASGRDEALEIFNESIYWLPGFSVTVRYEYITEDNQVKTYVLAAIGVGEGKGQANYNITTDSKVLEDQIIRTLYHTEWNMNGARGTVLNGHGDESVNDPFIIQELN